MTVESILGDIRTMLELNSVNEKWLKKRRRISVQYEFTVGDATHSYYCVADGPRWTFTEGTLPESECDVILETTPDILSDILHGRLGGREAIVSGKLNMRRAPSMPMLLMMRGMFNRYQKAVARGEVA
jgi:putative sterol carrier protein